MNEIKIKTKYTVEDYIRTEKFLKNLRKPSGIIINFGSIFIFVFGLINMFIAYVAMNKMEFLKAFYLLLMAVLIFFSTYKIIILYNVSLQLLLFKRNVKKHFDPNSIAYSERHIVFGEEGILETHKFGQYLTNWEAISKVVETDEDFFFYLHNTIRFQPKRDVSDEQIDLLRILIKANLKENAAFRYLTTE